MKTFYSKILILVLSLIIFSCSTNDDDGTNSDLPEITSEGAYTFGCKINGQVFLPKNDQGCLNCGSPNPLRLGYSQDRENDEYHLSVIARNDINGDASINLDLYLDEPLEERVYDLSESYIPSIDRTWPNASSSIYREISGETINSYFKTTSEVTGTLEIIEINESERFIAGIFQFQAINEEGKVLNFTDGRFDIRIY
ncbi:DUF6252 family protein [Gramella lutea]|uniref:DUF6252 family protein n=1 Tax=Christiangramia lutea TaxID=1607951 RepID=A0A9X1V4R5_9FLAO|nr:DUF6252 family protein [Christiangramia lutea]MCH4824567.1 DUF6252 family protein [Christiangramia lutea]